MGEAQPWIERREWHAVGAVGYAVGAANKLLGRV